MGTPEHNQVSITWQHRQAEVDEELAPVILALWKLGIDTCNSCQENQPGIVWIEFLTSMDAKSFLDIVAVHPDEYYPPPLNVMPYDRIVGCGSDGPRTNVVGVLQLGHSGLLLIIRNWHAGQV
jgi:hypothetical protein